MRLLRTSWLACGGAIGLGVIALASGAARQPQPAAGSSAATPPPPPMMIADTAEERIARALIQASPVADPADPKARDAAAQKLAGVKILLDRAGENILWGGYEEAKGYDPAAYRLTAFNPMVWAKLYLSTFMFPGGYQVRKEGRFTVLEMAAQFRAGLDPGDYPYPFWHSPKKWQAYSNAEALLLVFERGTFIAAYRKAGPPRADGPAVLEWDGRWRWIDDKGEPQPRVALYSYLLSPENPHAASLDAAYRNLEARFRGENCLSCHAPDNVSQADHLFLLDFPNQALAARHSLVPILRGNKMPPADMSVDHPSGITDERARADLISLATLFEQEADAALEYEASHPRPTPAPGGSDRSKRP